MSQSLYTQLTEAYTDSNLNRITACIIDLYKSRQYEEIQKISRIVSEYVEFDDEQINKCFSKLVMLYHPDRGAYYREEIDQLQKAGKSNEFKQFEHILKIQDIEDWVVEEKFNIDEDIDYAPQYEWDYQDNGFEYFFDSSNEHDDIYTSQTGIPEPNSSFYRAVKRKIYGSLYVQFPPYYLEDFDEIDMAEYEIMDLDGIQYCTHVRILDLSGNQIVDITDLWELEMVEELYLADNQIGLIDPLNNLSRLRIVDLSRNEIDDISALYDLPNLEYVNVIGNRVPAEQIEYLKEQDVVVVA